MENGRRSPSEPGAPVVVIHAGVLHLAQQVVLRVARIRFRAAMQDQGLARLAGKHQVASQVQQLCVTRGETAVVVEAGLADGDDQGVRGEFPDRGPARVVSGRGFVRVGHERQVALKHGIWLDVVTLQRILGD